ncbi:MAG TPA: TonB family protein [Chryseosolibacter sp.]
MDAKSIAFRHWEDVVFEYRNKAYGAYFLRRLYAQRLMFGLALTLVIVALVLSIQRIYSSGAIARPVEPPLTGGGSTPLPPPVIERQRPAGTVVHQETVNTRNRPILVTRDVVEQTEVDAISDFVSGEGLENGDPGTFDGEGTIPAEETAAVIDPPFVDFAEVMPSYEGGLEAMMKFIQKKIHYPRAPRQMGIEGTVYVRFVVNGNGSISGVEVIRGFHPDCDREAMRVVSMLPAWKGGSHNGRPVAVRMVLPIRFSLRQ